MAVVGFKLSNIAVNAVEAPKGQFKVSPKLDIEDVSVEDFPMSKDGSQKVIRTKFSCGFVYEGGSDITFTGTQLYLVPKEIAKEVSESYEKTKKLPRSVVQRVMGGIFSRCQTTSIMLAKEVGLPCPIPLPKLSVTSAAEKKA